jgi:putative transposase
VPRTYSQLYFHVVFSTKDRVARIEPHWAVELYRLMGGLVRDQGGRLLAAGGMPDHVHLLMSLRPSPSLSEVLKVLKGTSSRWVNERDPGAATFCWQEGYGAFTVSPGALVATRRYIDHQAEHHRVVSASEEWADLLRRHGLEP